MLLKHAQIPTSNGLHLCDIIIKGEKIEAVDAHLTSSDPAIDLEGKIVLPSAVDVHVHFNEPGRTDWEGWSTGSTAALFGGVGTVFEMPLNAHPPTLNAAAFERKAALAAKKSIVDFGLWGGCTPENLDQIASLAESGVIGFKAFMSNSGIDEFQNVDRASLREGMQRVAETGKILALHAEDEALCTQLGKEARDAGRLGPQDWVDSRPVESELNAIAEAIELYKETGCRLHIVHVSNRPGIDLISQAKAEGVDISAETCPHYLALDRNDLETLGAVAKCAPPLREAAVVADLWQRVCGPGVDSIGSDHSPCPTAMKTNVDNFADAWGGISGIQNLLHPLIDRVIQKADLGWQRLVDLVATYPAQRFGLGDRGKIEAGLLADLVIVDPSQSTQISTDSLKYRHKHSPYVGKTFAGNIFAVVRRGHWHALTEDHFSGPLGSLVGES
ncbi:MAG: allantoinase AllB [Opitutales bacterium]|nr:allantoinase AllB [Opitutales bacterium]